MKNSRLVIPAMAVFFVAAGPIHAGTDGQSDQKTTTQENTVQEQGMESDGSMKQQWDETMKALGSYTAEQRDKAVKAGKETLDAMDKRIERMEAWTSEHWSSLSDEAREKKIVTLKAMREQRNKVAEWYGGMKHSSADAWESVKEGFIKSYGKLQSVYSNAVDSSGSEDEAPDPRE